ncbi:5-oxoprolinase subunit PxpA [Arcobacter peruensis]|uniref:5-oxoprolinase subunit PxpA n=1 Tax=Arcobacter peruensis TaxID=2320140 RepID=UPI000F097F2B|nr:5-oxoprolinase subunit PxpA [Arcobacter peruensis]
MSIKLNCDMGESFGLYKIGLDEEIMPYINMANLACGFHAGDSVTMNKSVQLAKKNNVEIGAHPGYQDLVGFGRRSIACTQEEIISMLVYQVGALEAFCKMYDTKVTYVKPHGALYQDMMKDDAVFMAIIKAISSYNTNLKLMILSSPRNHEYAKMAKEYNIELLFEVFADRNYNDNGSLVSRALDNAIIKDEADVISRIKSLKEKGTLLSISGKELSLQTDVLCVHGDTNNALEFIQILRKEISA